LRISLFMLLLLLFGCSAAPLEINDRLDLGDPEALILDIIPPEKMSLNWAPQPINDFIISQNADGLTGRNNYQDFAIGQLISKRVEDYLGTVSRIVPNSDNRATVTMESAQLNYKYGWKNLDYVKLLINATVTVDRKSRSKIYYRQIVDQPELSESEMLDEVFDGVSVELGQDILSMLAR
jgi:hypothetical protein